MLKFVEFGLKIKYFTSVNDTYFWLPDEEVEYVQEVTPFKKVSPLKATHLAKDSIMGASFIPLRCGGEIALIFCMQVLFHHIII